MTRRNWSARLIVATTVAALLMLLGGLAARMGQPYPGFFPAPDFRIFPSESDVALQWGDRIVGVEGWSPITLEWRVTASDTPIRYEIDRGGRRLTLDVAPHRFTWRILTSHFGVFFVISAVMLAVGIAVFAQNPRARPNRNFLIYMCLWAVSNVAVPESVLGSSRVAACLVGFIAIVLSVHGWVFFLTYPANPPREVWLERHWVIACLYACALVAGSLAALSLVVLTAAALMTTNIAARLAAQAQGGEIVLSEQTRGRLGSDVPFEAMGLRELKGVERAIPLYRLR